MKNPEQNKLILIGYRATGKSTLAIRLAQRLHWSVFDSDLLIEERAQKNIAQIFAEDGESVFRVLEAQIVAEVLKQPEPFVLATGGGVPLCQETRIQLRKFGIVVWLRANVETIFQRMFSDDSTTVRRPALTDLSPQKEIENVLMQRSPIYQETAHFSVHTDQKSIDEIINEILAKTENVLDLNLIC